MKKSTPNKSASKRLTGRNTTSDKKTNCQASARKLKELIISTTYNDGSPTSFSIPESNFSNFLNPKVVIEPLTEVEKKPDLEMLVKMAEQNPPQSSESRSLLGTVLNTPEATVTGSNIKQSSKRTLKDGKSKVCFTLLLLRNNFNILLPA